MRVNGSHIERYRYHPLHSNAGKLIEAITYFIAKSVGKVLKFYTADSVYCRKMGKLFAEKIQNGETLYLLGIIPSGHNAAAALIEVSSAKGINVLCNNEEERYSGIKNDGHFPEHSLNDILKKMATMGLSPKDIFLVVASWDYIKGIATVVRHAVEEAPQSFNLVNEKASPHMNFWHFIRALKAPNRLKNYLQSKERIPVIGMKHHNNHAYYAYAMSPFYNSEDPVILVVMDGFGDDGSISHYVAQGNKIERIRNYSGIMDSQGLLYAVISSTQGGWEPLSSEGRYMGASAWGDMNRLSNPYYKRLRQIVQFQGEGWVYVNRSLINYHKYGQVKPYAKSLIDILGEPIPQDKIWNPDIVLNVDDIQHAPITRQRVDKAAALQLVYEDALFHMVDYLIKKTGSNKLILSGGTALNCIANMKLLNQFNASYYRKNLQKKDTRLHLWVPPNPSDTGTAMGAAYHFALLNKVNKCTPLKHAFLCGNPPDNGEVVKSIQAHEDLGSIKLGNLEDKNELNKVADFMAFVISKNGIIGLYQGAGETGPRALGHRSILANPCNPDTLNLLNSQVKFRERIRPLAPVLTLTEAKRFFHLSKGAAMANYNAYNYMVLTVEAKKKSYAIIPSVIHVDGTSRIQICRKETDPLTYAILKSLKQYIGVEVAVNTSLNVGTPIVHSPEQAIQTLYRSKGLSALVLVENNGDAHLIWHAVDKPPKDAGKQLGSWYEEWKSLAQKQAIIHS
ncbi:carbamoyltransferase C-terminal domain-containing protein [Mangrovibacterium lignilyticum]|uniref:carbamoyltransferase C-terminal domain-containing protein n=1 Tax=Mangrovibacterium lignilyticum TaxID=2668052 RepID=UPI0013D06DC8|nr:carbamoyltransferase C-terminal domain-containing protein [Mangrovibacterium lignilyticum]